MLRQFQVWRISSTQSKWQQILTSVSLRRLKNNNSKKADDMDVVLIFLLSLMNFVAKLPNIENKLFLPFQCSQIM